MPADAGGRGRRSPSLDAPFHGGEPAARRHFTHNSTGDPIFLMARVREETLRYGTRVGMLRGLAVTGAVITSAGIVLAGTFSAVDGAGPSR